MKTENRIQQEIFTWHWNRFPEERGLLFHINNSARDKMQGNLLKSMGMVKGVADMCYLSKNGAVFLEIKTDKGSQSIYQKDWQTKIEAQGFKYEVVRSLEEVKEKMGWN